MNFARVVVDAAETSRPALVKIARDGSRGTWSMGEVASASARLAGTLAARGVGRGDTVITLIGNRPEWVLTMVACFRLGAVVLPCTEQLRAKDLRLRLEATSPVLVVADERNRAELKAAGPSCEVLLVPDPALWGDAVAEAPAVELAEDDPCLITFTSTNYFARLERGGINPTWDTVRRVADALDQTVSELAHAAEEIERKPRRADGG